MYNSRGRPCIRTCTHSRTWEASACVPGKMCVYFAARCAPRAYKRPFAGAVYDGLGSMSHTCRPVLPAGHATTFLRTIQPSCAHECTSALRGWREIARRRAAAWGNGNARYTPPGQPRGQHTWNKLSRGGRWTAATICHDYRGSCGVRCLDPFINWQRVWLPPLILLLDYSFHECNNDNFFLVVWSHLFISCLCDSDIIHCSAITIFFSLS